MIQEFARSLQQNMFPHMDGKCHTVEFTWWHKLPLPPYIKPRTASVAEILKSPVQIGYIVGGGGGGGGGGSSFHLDPQAF